MPVYIFKCDQCENIKNENLPISEFLKNKLKKIICENCKEGVLIHQIHSVNSSVEKSIDLIKMDAKEQVNKIVEKVKSGDLKTINDVYGDRPNPHKNGV